MVVTLRGLRWLATSLVSGTLLVLFALALTLTGAPWWLVWGGIAAGFVVMVCYFVTDELEKERKRRSGR